MREGAEPLQPKSSRGEDAGREKEGGPGQVRVPPVSRHVGLPNSRIRTWNPRPEHGRSPAPAKPRTETSGRAPQTRDPREHFRSVLRGNGAVRQPGVTTTDRTGLCHGPSLPVFARRPLSGIFSRRCSAAL